MLSLRVRPPTSFDFRRFNVRDLERRWRLSRDCFLSFSPKFEENRGVRFGVKSSKSEVSFTAAEEEETLPEELQPELMPKHVAIIMDGNGRWAKNRGLQPWDGHRAGVEALKEIVELSGKWGIQVLTVFAFSTDNWIRPRIEIDFLFSLFERSLKSEFQNLAKNNVRISIIGDSSKLPKSLLRVINEVEEVTKNNTRLQLIVAVGYSGKYDVLQACRGIAQRVKDGEIEVEEIDERLIEEELETNCTEFPYPDLLIRTSGELRVSNFLLWQLAYTELFFAQELWPDFGRSGFIEALTSFQQRQRRFGGRKS
ncbi:Decaprenyl diphosphate synthase-like superfamily [Arabidopsis suecica]|uniref:Alkyl transferase n=1 Tax=Arabidopsis suecica TaxID=45249 RepID=A0A8T1Y5E2_ARASU|nr:Decaprenyl diphosphate synthase-like superfamily [Arabidopsis suecica]